MKTKTDILEKSSIGVIVFAVLLFTTGFFVPPLGVIDGSVLKAGGILTGMQGLLLAMFAVKKGRGATFTKGDTNITISTDDDNED